MIIFLVCISLSSLAKGEIATLSFLDLGNSYLELSDISRHTNVTLSTGIRLTNTTIHSVFIYNSGVLSFGSQAINITNNTPSLPLDDTVKVLAPFWNDQSSINHVKYLLVANKSDDQGHLINDVGMFLINYRNSSSYNADLVFVIQWINEHHNSFQLVLTTDGATTLAIFTYQCGRLNLGKSDTAVIGYSFNQEVYRTYTFDNTTQLACQNLPYSNYSNLVYQLSNGPPLLTVEPINTIGQVGKSVVFHCTAFAVPRVSSIVWIKNNDPLLLTSASITHITIQLEGDITTSYLSIQDLSMIDDQNVYKCIVNNDEGTVESNEGILTVNLPVVISTPPISLTLKENTEILFSCIAKGKPTPSIVWIGPNGELPGNDANIRIEIFEPTLSTKLSILIFMSLNYINHGNHSCKASNLAHGINNPLDVDIQPFTIIVQTKPILVNSSPLGIVALLGNSVTIEFTLVRAEPSINIAEVEWMFSNYSNLFQPIVCNNEMIQCIVSDNRFSIVITNVSLLQEGQYNVKVSNSIGNSSTTQIVFVQDIVRIHSNSSITNHIVNETDLLVLDCTATGIPLPNITWSKNGSQINLPSNQQSLTISTNQDSNSVYRVISMLSISSVTYSDRGTYICTASNIDLSDGSHFSYDTSLFTIIVQTLPIITPQSNTITGLINQSIEIGVVIARDYPFVKPSDINWVFNGLIIIQSDKYSLAVDKKLLTISSLSSDDDGMYTIMASNAAGYTKAVITLHVLAPTNITTPISNVIVNETANVVIDCIGYGNPLPTITWEREDGAELPENSEIVTNISNNDGGHKHVRSSLILKDVSVTDNDVVFVCIGSNNVTNVLSTPENATILLTIEVPLMIEIIGDDIITVILHRNEPIMDTVMNFKIKGGKYAAYELGFLPTLNNTITPILIRNSTKHNLIYENHNFFITIANISYSDQGIYTLKLWNIAGFVQTSIILIVNVETEISNVGQTIVELNDYDTATFVCVADGIPRPTEIFWFRNATLMDPVLFKKITITSLETTGFRQTGYQGIQSILKVENITCHSDIGLYLCRSSNGIGQPAILSEPYELRIITAPSLNLCAKLQPCVNGGTCIDNDKSYNCLCTFDYTGQNCEEDVTVVIPPQITKHPQNTIGNLYSQVSLFCEVTGDPRPFVAWYKDGEMIDDGDSNTYQFTIYELGLKDRGFYHCMITSRVDGEIIKLKSDIALVNIKGIVQYKANLIILEDFNRTRYLNDQHSTQQVVDVINEFVAGSIIRGDSSLFFIEKLNMTDDVENYTFIPIVITIITSDGGSDKLLQAVQQRLSDLSIDLAIDLSFLVTERHDGCQSEETVIPSISANPQLDVIINWPEVNIGQDAVVSCPCGGIDLGNGNLEARRYCGGTFTEGAQWEDGFVTPCNFSNTAREICNLANLPPSDRLSQLGNITDFKMDPTIVSVASAILLTTTNAALGKVNLTEMFYNVIDNINVQSTDVLRESIQQANSSARLLESVEILAENLEVSENKSSLNISLSSFSIEVQRLTNSTTDDGSNYSYQDTQQSVFIPKEIIQNNISWPLTIVLARFQVMGLFVTREKSNMVVDSDIISASISQMNIEGLTEPVVITINTNTLRNRSRLGCYFWDPSLDGGYGNWSQNNCISNFTKDGQLECRCNHLTSFAVLLDASPEPIKQDDSVVAKSLSAVSYIGVILSIVCLIVTIITYLGSRKLRQSEHGKLLLSLCFSLLGLYCCFILAIHGTPVPAMCAVISVLLQYFLLVTFFVMASEALNLYMKLVIVLGKGITRYFVKATIVSWITPVFIVVFCFAPNYKLYIGDHFCRVYDIPFYFGILVPFIIVYIFNWTIFVIIMFQLLKKRCSAKFKESFSKHQKMSFKQQFMIALALSSLFGLGWGLGLFATQGLYTVTEIRDTFAALFILLTSFQGLFIFIMHCLKSREVRKAWLQWGYKAVGKEYSTMANSSFSQSQLSRRKQNSMRTIATSISHSGTLKEYSNKTQNSFDDDLRFDTFEELEKELEDKMCDEKLTTVIIGPSENDNNTAGYPVPCEIKIGKGYAPDFHNSYSSLTSTGSGLCGKYGNPLQNNDIKATCEDQRFSSISVDEDEDEANHVIMCSRLPNPMLDSDTENNNLT